MAFAGLMKGKRGLVMGVANQHSIAWGIAQALHEAGAELAFSYQGDLFRKRVVPLTEPMKPAAMIDCDVSIDFSVHNHRHDRMTVIATFNLKGGVGKTAAAVNLAYIAAMAGRRTLLWDLDAQGAASFYLRAQPPIEGGASALLADKHGLGRAIRTTAYAGLEIIPADFSYRNLDLELSDYKKSTRRLLRLLRAVLADYDLVFLDCAPSMSTLAENIFNMADVILVPLVPTHLSLRAFAQLQTFHTTQAENDALLLPFFSMVDRRKNLHRDLIVEFARAQPELLRSYIPYASEVERMGEHRAPINTYADSSPGGRAFRALWAALCARLDALPRRAPSD